MRKNSTICVHEYAGNPLIEACGPIPDERDLTKHLTRLPAAPQHVSGTPNHIRLHQAGILGELHIPTREGVQVATTIDLLLRQSYVQRRPLDPETWRHLYCSTGQRYEISSRPLVTAVFGVSGLGKSRAIERALALYDQVVIHENFPAMAGPFPQVLWLKIDVPGTGRAVDLAEQLMVGLDSALGTSHFESTLRSSRKNGQQMLRAWLQKASLHFLGVLVLDEVQNFFKLPTKKARSTMRNNNETHQLRIIEDEALKFILTLANTSRIAIVAAGTPDGMAAFSSRFSTSQRMTTGGFHHISPIQSSQDSYYKKYLFPTLCKYQWLDEKIGATDELRDLLFEKTAGIPRILSNLWFFSQRCALERKGTSMSFSDIDRAMQTYMAPLVPAVNALRSNDARKLSVYQDIVSSVHIGTG
jgi:hypothetical protein